MKRNFEETEKETINGALGISDAWKESTIRFCLDEITEQDRVTDVIKSLLLDIKEEEFGEGNYELTSYEKKLLFAGMLLEKSLAQIAKKASGMESLLAMLKMLGEDGPSNESEDDDDSEK